MRPILNDDLTPKLVSALREGYGAARFRADIIAGLTVSIVALPLSMAIAIASGAKPENGLFTAIIGGFIISALSGSRFQIGGPAGAFIVLVASIIADHGFEGLLLATLMAGFLLVVAGVFRLGTYIKYVPHPVTVGFTAGIAVIIFASQLKELLGLSSAEKEPAAVLAKLAWIWKALPSLNWTAAGLSAGSILLILLIGKLRPRWPGFLIAVAAGALATWAFHLPVETIGTRFGGIPASLPAPSLPAVSLAKIYELMPAAFALALLGGIESLLSAVVADSMSGRRHRPNMELVAQGFANLIAPLFGGITATGTIARTATNVRAGAKTPVSGMLHAAFLLLMMALAAPLAWHIPLSVLGAILAVVAWKMAERHEVWALLRASWGDATVLAATFGLTVFRDLTEGIVVGVMLGSLLFMHRIAQAVKVHSHQGGNASGEENPVDDGVIIHRISGAFFFGATGTVAMVLDRLHESPKAYILDMREVPFVDSSAAHLLRGFLRKARDRGGKVYFTGTSDGVREDLARFRIGMPDVLFTDAVTEALADIRRA